MVVICLGLNVLRLRINEQYIPWIHVDVAPSLPMR